MNTMPENMYFECRKRAASTNDRLNSRAGAAECLGISESSLAHYELGITKSVPVDVVVLMAELYNAPELRNNYCVNECPIGKALPIATGASHVERSALRLLGSLDPDDLNQCAKTILRVTKDGVVTAAEAAELRPVIEALDRISVATSELKIIVERALRTDT